MNSNLHGIKELWVSWCQPEWVVVAAVDHAVELRVGVEVRVVGGETWSVDPDESLQPQKNKERKNLTTKQLQFIFHTL